MSYLALYRKWRPENFISIVEQEHVVTALKNAVFSGKVAHAYLFSGTRGTGKTTAAKILARAVNCENNENGDPCNKCKSCKGLLDGSIMDVIEIDAASNNSVDNIREIREEVIYTPSQTKYKVYIIDEVHMLSIGAFNALLKTLEEPPSHIIFILATTEPHKLPATIISRCQQFDFRRISNIGIENRIKEIANDSDVVFEETALKLIAKYAKGGLRDAISLLDQCLSLGNKKLTVKDVQVMGGIFDEDIYFQVLISIKEKDFNNFINIITDIYSKGRDLYFFLQGFIEFIRDILIYITTGSIDEIYLQGNNKNNLNNIKSTFSSNDLIYIIKELSAKEALIKWSDNNKILLEVLLIKIAENYSNDDSDLLEKISLLEKRIRYLEENKNDTSFIKTKEEEIKLIVKEKVQPYRIYSDTWKEFLDIMKRNGKMVLYSNLINVITKLVENDLHIVFTEEGSFAEKVVKKPENIKYIEDTIGDLLNKKIKVKCTGHKEEIKKEDIYINNLNELSKKLNIDFKIEE